MLSKGLQTNQMYLLLVTVHVHVRAGVQCSVQGTRYGEQAGHCNGYGNCYQSWNIQSIPRCIN